MANFPGPYEIEITYTTSPSGQPTLEHKMRLNLNISGSDPTPGTAMADINFLERSGVPVNAVVALDAWIDLIKVRFNTSQTAFNVADLFKYTPGTFQRQFISSYALAETGSSASGNTAASQEIFTSRTLEGGIHKINLMESINTANARTGRSGTTGSVDAIFDFLESVDNWILGRDTSYPIAGLNHLAGQNEKLFKLRFRPS